MVDGKRSAIVTQSSLLFVWLSICLNFTGQNWWSFLYNCTNRKVSINNLFESFRGGRLSSDHNSLPYSFQYALALVGRTGRAFFTTVQNRKVSINNKFELLASRDVSAVTETVYSLYGLQYNGLHFTYLNH